MSGNFTFKKFTIRQDRCGMKVGTDGVLLGAWAGEKISAMQPLKILDIGTGTGLIALMMAQRFPLAHIDAIDIDLDACIQARENISESPFSERITVHHQSLQQFVLNSSSDMPAYDVIVSNPPFFVNSLKNPDAKRSVARHTDTLPFVELLKCSEALTKETGVIDVILPVDVGEQFLSESNLLGLFEIKKCYVKTVERKAPKRVMLELGKARAYLSEVQTHSMMDSSGIRSDWYTKLTDKFYL